jgi:hypothetical protein
MSEENSPPGGSDPDRRVIHFAVTAALKAQLVRDSRRAGVSLNEWILYKLEQGYKFDPLPPWEGPNTEAERAFRAKFRVVIDD